ncbi:BTAD domain-containing putative transcriptional regulator [Amycolatopsis benzoatilytica]|uniref:BTAD domain-containing putative transcriptional regulator n=1 Tax=Amycolatopsis benzoatilytica TaxID=346045 RepID=UPI00036E963D|nr:BTAD domain-containing putative transcriptional regulator [Amycolatopsis benzoatilytica]
MTISFSVLGPLTAHDAHGPVALPGPRHRAVLARLLVARGQVVSTDALIDALWPEPRTGAAGAVQTFVGALRRSLEPDRPPRTPAKLLVTEGPGYALRAEPGEVDAWRFEAVVRGTPSVEQLDEALGWWRGEPYGEFADEPWARAERARLTELRLLALERRAAGLLDAGRAAEAVPDLESHVDAHPLREEAWRLLALALYRAGRQGDALAALRRARAVLATELGIDPGPALRKLEQDVLAQAPQLVPVRAARLAGREPELARLAEAAAEVADHKRFRLVLVSGEAGAGKTALVEEFAARLGWTTAWGANPDGAGVPPAWPWTRILAALGEPVPPRAKAVDSGADPAVARFQWQQQVSQRLSRHGPLLVVLDDLQWAGEETLALLASATPESVLLVATYRTTEVSADLTGALGRLARADPIRLYLGGLSVDAVAELVGTDSAAVIHRRSGGNPFFVKELARVLDAEGDLPDGVRDVVRNRLAALPGHVRVVLDKAAVIGADVDLGLLGDVLEELEIAVRSGFLLETGPRSFRFAHALVRDAVYDDLPLVRRAQLHREVGESLARRRPGEVSLLAHHFLRAGDDRGTGYAQAAAERAEREFAPHEALRLWRAALAQGPRTVELLMGLARASAFTGSLAAARRYRAEALDLAGDDPALTIRVLTAFDVPGIWTENDDPVLARRIADAAARVLVADPPVRARLLATIALELRNEGGQRALDAALEAEELARSTGDPALLALALNARWTQTFTRAGLAPERARIGEEIVEVAARHRLVSFEVLGHLVLVQAHSALADFAAADRHSAAADRLGEQYDLPLVSVFTDWYRALRIAVTGSVEAAEAAYRAAAARLPGSGMSGVDRGLLSLARHCLYRQHNLESPVDDWRLPADRPDLLLELRACLTAATGDARECYERLAPAENELAGAGSGMVTLGPVAYYLGELAEKLGLPSAAHFRKAEDVARRAGAAHWLAESRARQRVSRR